MVGFEVAETRRVKFELVGTMPLLMHYDNIEGGDDLVHWRRDPANKNLSVPGDDRSPAWTWTTYLYHDGEHVVMPTANVMVCLRQAAAQIIMKKQKTFKEVSQGGVKIELENFDFFCGEQQLKVADCRKAFDGKFHDHLDLAQSLGFRLFAKRARVGNAKHVRVRPRFDKWSVTGELLIEEPVLTNEVVEQLFYLAGKVGLCDWRPGCKTPGPYGRFTAVVKWA